MIDYNEILRGYGYWLTGMQLDIQASLRMYLENNNLTQQEFAERLDVSQSYISQVLNGNFDFRLSKMIELYLAIGKVPFIAERDLEEVIQEWQQLVRKNGSIVERKRASTPKRKVK